MPYISLNTDKAIHVFYPGQNGFTAIYNCCQFLAYFYPACSKLCLTGKNKASHSRFSPYLPMPMFTRRSLPPIHSATTLSSLPRLPVFRVAMPVPSANSKQAFRLLIPSSIRLLIHQTERQKLTKA